MNKTIKSLSPNKATGPDHIPLKIIKTATNVTDSHLAHIIKKDLKGNKFSENAKRALVRLIYQKLLYLPIYLGVKLETIDNSVF